MEILFFSGRTYHDPLPEEDLSYLSRKNFVPETVKKIQWATKMYHDWRNYHHSQGFQFIPCDLDDVSTITEESLIHGICRLYHRSEED